MEDVFILEAGAWFLFVGTPPSHPPPPLPTANGTNKTKNIYIYIYIGGNYICYFGGWVAVSLGFNKKDIAIILRRRKK